MAMQVLLVLLSTILLACAQHDGPVREYPAITGRPEEHNLVLAQDPALREFAAARNERIVVRIDNPHSTVIVEEGVNVNMDCLPWLRRFRGFLGGTIQWLVQPRDENGHGKKNL